MSKRKTYGEIAYNASVMQFRVTPYALDWKDIPQLVKDEYEHAACAVIRAHTRRLLYYIRCESIETNGMLMPQFQRNLRDGTVTGKAKQAKACATK